MKRLVITYITILFFISVFDCALALSADDNAIKKQIYEILSGIEWEPPLDYWKKFGFKAVPVLSEFAKDSQKPMFVRVRAIRAMAAFANKTEPFNIVASFLKPHNPSLLRRTAARTLARGWHKKSLTVLKQYITDQDPLLREAIGFALSQISTPEARNLLNTMLKNEQQPVIKKSIKQAVKIWCANFGCTTKQFRK